MSVKQVLGRLLQQEQLNFLLTNRIPRRQLTRLAGWFSQIEQPLVSRASIAAFRFFADDLDLHEAKQTRFRSLHHCFVRELKEGARPIEPDPAVLVSPCDAVVGACGRVRGDELVQAKGRRYTLRDLLVDPVLARHYEGGSYATLRLKASMYHRFHAPHDLRIEHVRYLPGDVWNVNPPTLARVDRLYARNERAVLRTRLAAGGQLITLVPVAAVLVASLRLHCLDVLLHSRYRGPQEFERDVAYRKGEELGWFQHGSTIVVFAPAGFALCANVRPGEVLRMGRPLLRLS